MLLRVLGKKPGKPSSLKKQLTKHDRNGGTKREDYQACLGLDVLKGAREQEETIDKLLKVFGL